jgi:hypothetical protein
MKLAHRYALIFLSLLPQGGIPSNYDGFFQRSDLKLLSFRCCS